MPHSDGETLSLTVRNVPLCTRSFDNPVFASIELDYADVDGDPTGTAANEASKMIVFYELDLGLNHVVRFSPSRLVSRDAHFPPPLLSARLSNRRRILACVRVPVLCPLRLSSANPNPTAAC